MFRFLQSSTGALILATTVPAVIRLIVEDVVGKGGSRQPGHGVSWSVRYSLYW